MTTCLTIVPARGGSKRLPGKNLRHLGDRTLLAHTASAIERSGLNIAVLLSTDDDAIAAEGQRLGWQVPFRRPAHLAEDGATTVDAVLHALDWHRNAHGRDPDTTMVLQPTSPFRGGACLAAAVRMLQERPDIDSVIAMSESNLPAARLYVSDSDGRAVALATDRRAPVYRPNGALYLTRTRALRRDRSLYAGAVHPLVLGKPYAIDIDTPADWALAEAVLAAGLPPEPDNFAPTPAADVNIS
jgi:CMP-N-acetylneuraminic acid synthetase